MIIHRLHRPCTDNYNACHFMYSMWICNCASSVIKQLTTYLHAHVQYLSSEPAHAKYLSSQLAFTQYLSSQLAHVYCVIPLLTAGAYAIPLLTAGACAIPLLAAGGLPFPLEECPGAVLCSSPGRHTLVPGASVRQLLPAEFVIRDLVRSLFS